MIQLIGVSKRYGRGPLVVTGIDVGIRPGQALVVHGANGSGKSTLLRLIAGCLAPTRGRITGRPATVSYVPDRFPARLSHAAHPSRLPRWVRHADEPAVKGNAQKVGLARVLCSGAPLLVLDEPWSGLDAEARPVRTAAVEQLVAAGTAVVLTDHTRTAEALAGHRAMLLHRSGLSKTGTPPAETGAGLRGPGTRHRATSAGLETEADATEAKAAAKLQRQAPVTPARVPDTTRQAAGTSARQLDSTSQRPDSTRQASAIARRMLPRERWRSRCGVPIPVCRLAADGFRCRRVAGRRARRARACQRQRRAPARRPTDGLLRAGGAPMSRLTGLVRYLGADLLRSQRFLLPVFLYVLLLAPLFNGDPGPPPQLWTVTVLVLYPVSCWLAVTVANAEDPTQRQVTLADAGGPGRVAVGVLVTCLLADAGLVAGVLADVVPPGTASPRRPSPPGCSRTWPSPPPARPFVCCVLGR